MDEILDFNLTGSEVNLDPTATDTSQIDFAENSDLLELTGSDSFPNDLESMSIEETEVDLQSIEATADSTDLRATDVDPLTGNPVSVSIDNYNDTALGIIENAGQLNPEAEFVVKGHDGMSWFLTDNGAIAIASQNLGEVNFSDDRLFRTDSIQFHRMNDEAASSGIELQFLNTNPNASAPIGMNQIGSASWLIGNNSTQWKNDLDMYGRANYLYLYDGIDLSYNSSSGQLERQFQIDPGANPDAIQMNYSGVNNISVDANGSLILSMTSGQFAIAPPTARQNTNSIDISYEIRNDGSVGFELGEYDPSQPLSVTMGVERATFLDEGDREQVKDVAIDDNGNGYITGVTASVELPTFEQLQSGFSRDRDIFIRTLDESGNLRHTTIIGGSQNDEVEGIDVNAQGNAYITGATISPDLPVINAYQNTYQEPSGFNTSNAFVMKVAVPQFSGRLEYSTYLGGGSNLGHYGNDIAVNDAGEAYITGFTSGDFPTVNAIQDKFNAFPHTPAGDAFVTKLSSNGSDLIYSTYLGDSTQDSDIGYGIAIDDNGNAYVTGVTAGNVFGGNVGSISPNNSTSDLSPQGAIAPTGKVAANSTPEEFTQSDRLDVFVGKLSPDGTSVVYSQNYGEDGVSDRVSDITVDSQGSAYVAINDEIVQFEVNGEEIKSTKPGYGNKIIAQTPGKVLGVDTSDPDLSAREVSLIPEFENFIDYISRQPIEPDDIFFDRIYYLNNNSDVANAIRQGFLPNARDHYLQYGQFEGRNPSQMFDEQRYLAFNPDVASAVESGYFKSGFDHFVQYGFYEGRSNRTERFNESYYLYTNPDVEDAVLQLPSLQSGRFDSGYEHYIEHGQQEGRNPNKYYDEQFYLANNRDVVSAVEAGAFASGFDHYVRYGETEGRSPSERFNEQAYLDRYPDIANAVNAGVFRSGFDHFLQFGRTEGRVTSG